MTKATTINQFLLSPTSYTELTLNNTNLTNDNLAEFILRLSENTILTKLSLSNNQIGDVGMGYLAQALQGNQVLTTLTTC